MKEENQKISEICDKTLCTGCQACLHGCSVNAISMNEDEHGFFYPVVDQDKCIGCHECIRICPAINHRKDFNEPLKVFAGWIKDMDLRRFSTSGGAAYALSKKIVEEGGVFCGCRWNVDHAEHAFAENIQDLSRFQGSKYAYSDIGYCYSRIKDYLVMGRKVLFVGTGCQVAGLKSFLKKEYEGLLTVDILCHGIPSQKALRDRIQDIEKEGGNKVVDVRFRDKHEDQSHTCAKYIFENDESMSCSVFHDYYYCGFVKNYLLRPNCFSCQYARSTRVSDISLADFWGYEPGGFGFLSYRDGVSLVLANTEKGLEMINCLKNFKKEERPYYMAINGNQNLHAPQAKPVGYKEFWTRYLSGEKLSELSKEYFPKIRIPAVTKNDWRTYLKIIIGEKVKRQLTTTEWKKYLRWAYDPVANYYRYRQHKPYRTSECNRLLQLSQKDKHVFYLGITAHSNLGDMAQHFCIKRWIIDNYPNHELVMFESCVVTDPKFTKTFFTNLKKVFGKEDVVVFQSGYSTQDLGGDQPLMHRLVCEYMPEAHILMMPQTIYFQHEENRKLIADNHNKARNMLFLARDRVSYAQALRMFPDIHVEEFPDIVTTLIGTLSFANERKGVCLCTRNDGEKLYNKAQIDDLAKRLEAVGYPVKQKDTQAHASAKTIRANLEKFILEEIESYSKYFVTITDRYHGTIFSLCAGTPVIIIKTNDHKVTTGADWFKGVYDEYVYVAEDLDDAYEKTKMIMVKQLDHRLEPYFKVNYYDKLKELFDSKAF